MKLVTMGDQFAYLVGMGVMALGIMDFMDDDDGDEIAADAGGGGGDDVFDEGFDDGNDGLDDVDGGMDDWAEEGDEFGDMGGGNAATQELENRVDELENEVADISSTVNTVRSENEEISAKADDIEENVRKLLEIYEMVTRGVNPFVDDVQAGGAGEGGLGGDFGLFDDDAGDESDEDDLDDDVANADAESFFDDDAFDEDDEGETEPTVDDEDPTVDDESMLGDDLVPDGDADEAGADGDSGGEQAGGTTFQDLKEEYESGDADWADGEATDDGPEVDDEFEFETDPETAGEEAIEADETGTDEFEFEGPTDQRTEQAQVAEGAMRTGKPYLAELPPGYVSDLVAMEWVDFLVTEFGPETAVRTITYYRDIDWIGESVEDHLLAFADGIADVDDVDAGSTGPATLDIDDHVESLSFISQLTGDAIQRRIVDRCSQTRGEGRGIQR